MTTPIHGTRRRFIQTGAAAGALVSVGQPGDPDDDPTVAWPAERREFRAGTLSIVQAMPQTGAACEPINFDPLVMADGIAPSQDPILLFRSPAYAVSFAKRLSGQ